MQEFDHIQSLWQSHSVEVKISSDEMLAQAKKEVSSISNRSILNIAGMVTSFVAVGSLCLFINFQSWTTYAGIMIVLLAIAALTIILIQGHRLISRNDFTTHPNEFLVSLKQYQLSRFSLYNKMYWIYAVALTLGVGLYLIEVVTYMELWAQILIVLFSFLWMIFCSTLVRKAVIKKDRERIALLIEKFERLGSQFKTQS
ncbi:hypothetical protein SAMN05421820_10350 [Pedobacter steynii]|uniref:Uncharacterized protein n=1 Tax=Pedobacter steynii TaxID=430522 RepID=A0A1G9QY12_9SPHI|nr:hypothetical protein [Pedobacter steynii]NQX37948.1 hypothetical protein [Pedobacter steynii]SDM15843.1 hypothetical protein SAMN05421820_10350 [Pedobacter steynii]